MPKFKVGDRVRPLGDVTTGEAQLSAGTVVEVIGSHDGPSAGVAGLIDVMAPGGTIVRGLDASSFGIAGADGGERPGEEFARDVP